MLVSCPKSNIPKIRKQYSYYEALFYKKKSQVGIPIIIYSSIVIQRLTSLACLPIRKIREKDYIRQHCTLQSPSGGRGLAWE